MEFSQAIFERAAAAIVRQQRFARALLGGPVGHQKKISGFEQQLPAARIGPVDDHQQHALRVLPRAGLIRAEFDHILVAARRRTPHRPRQVRRGQRVEHGIGLQTPVSSQLLALLSVDFWGKLL